MIDKMMIDEKSELLFVLIVLLMLPTLYIVTTTVSKAKTHIKCTPVVYVDSGIPSDDVDSIKRDDQAICGIKCQSYCMVEFGKPCKVYKAIYSNIYGVSCVCKVPIEKKDYADDCI